MSHIYKRSRLKMTSLQIVFETSTAFETEGKHGTMHLMEHLICKSLKGIENELASNGIRYNASTSSNAVRVYFIGLDSRLSPLKTKLVKLVLSDLEQHINEEEFLHERATVLQEYTEVQSSSDAVFENNIFRRHFGLYGCLGLYQDIAQFSFADAIECQKRYFKHPTCIAEVGPQKSNFSFVEFAPLQHIKQHTTYKDDYKLVYDEEPVVPQKSWLGISKKVVSATDYPYLQFANQMLSYGMNSPLVQEIRVKRGLSYSPCTHLYTYRKEAFFMLSAGTTSDKMEELDTTFRHIIDNVTNLLTEERFNIIMQRQKLLNEEANILRYSHCAPLILNYLKFCRLPNNLDTITYDKVMKCVAKYINLNNIAIFHQ